MSEPLYLGIEIGGTKLQLVIGDAEGNIVARERFTVDRERAAEGIRSQIAAAMPALVQIHSPRAIGVGFGGPTNWRDGEIVLSHHIPGWSGFPLAAWLSENAGGIPAFVDNDANVAGLAEAIRGAGRGYPTIFYVTLGSGVGGGLIQHGNIFHGGGATETEIGHLRLDREGTMVESRCSGWAVDQRIQKLITENPSTPLAELVSGDNAAPASHLAGALEAGDDQAAALLHEVGSDLGFALAQVTQLMSPHVIVIGGGLALVGAPLLAAIQSGLNVHVMDALKPTPRVFAAALAEDVVPVGAVLLAARRHTHSPP